MPEISVIVPFFNPPILQFRYCIESILNQSFKDFELLLIDDGSSSKHFQIAEEYCKLDSRIKVFHKKNSGVADSRNFGILQSSGEFISFVDSDDFVEDNFLYSLHTAIQDSDVAICSVCEQYYPVENMWFDRQCYFSFSGAHLQLQYANFSVNKLYRSSIIKSNHIFFNPAVKLGEDALFLADYYDHCSSFRCISTFSYHYVPSNGSAVRTYAPNYWDWEKEVIKRQWDQFHQYNLSPDQTAVSYRWLLNKIKSAISYYLNFETDSKLKSSYINTILSSDLFKLLYDSRNKIQFPKLSRNERILLYIWHTFGASGAITFKKIVVLIKKIKH